MILAFAYPCLVVPDLEHAREFYEQMFGFKAVSKRGWDDHGAGNKPVGSQESSCQGYMLEGHNCYLELLEYRQAEPKARRPEFLDNHEPGIRHLAFYVDDCRMEYQRLQLLGGRAMGVPAGDAETGYAVYARDPFGNIIELAEIPNQAVNPTTLPGVSCLAGTDD